MTSWPPSTQPGMRGPWKQLAVSLQFYLRGSEREISYLPTPLLGTSSHTKHGNRAVKKAGKVPFWGEGHREKKDLK